MLPSGVSVLSSVPSPLPPPPPWPGPSPLCTRESLKTRGATLRHTSSSQSERRYHDRAEGDDADDGVNTRKRVRREGAGVKGRGYGSQWNKSGRVHFSKNSSAGHQGCPQQARITWAAPTRGRTPIQLYRLATIIARRNRTDQAIARMRLGYHNSQAPTERKGECICLETMIESQ